MASAKSVPRRCAIYTRKSSEEGLDQDFNSLDAQREACAAYVRSQAGEGWRLRSTHYDDGGFSGGSMDRPALEQLLADIRARKIDTVVVYKVDRLTRSLSDFARIVEVFDQHKVSFVSVTQQFNTTTSMGRLTLNMLLSFAQFEREVTGERIRDKIAASKAKGMWMGGYVPLGYEAEGRTLVVNEPEAQTVRTIFRLYLDLGIVREVKQAADQLGLVTKKRKISAGRMRGGQSLSRGHIYQLLGNPLYAGRIAHKDKTYPGLHPAIIDPEMWDAVQKRLNANAPDRPNENRKTNTSLLKGKLFDENGEPLTPSHAVKGNRRYRYYVSKHLLEKREFDHQIRDGWRLPAQEIERIVSEATRTLLLDHAAVANAARDAGLPANEIASLVETTSTQEKDTTKLVERVDLGTSEITIHLDLRPLSGKRDLRIQHAVQTQIRRRGVEMRMVLAAEPHSARGRPDPGLVSMIAKAHRWFEEIRTGKFQSLTAIADAEKVTRSYISQVLPLAFLSPDIVAKINDGRHPPDLTADELVKRTEVPLCWQDQAALFASS